MNENRRPIPVQTDAKFIQDSTSTPASGTDGDTAIQQTNEAGGVVRRLWAKLAGSWLSRLGAWVENATNWQFGSLRVDKTTGNWAVNTTPVATERVYIFEPTNNAINVLANTGYTARMTSFGDNAAIFKSQGTSAGGIALVAEKRSAQGVAFVAETNTSASGVRRVAYFTNRSTGVANDGLSIAFRSNDSNLVARDIGIIDVATDNALSGAIDSNIKFSVIRNNAQISIAELWGDFGGGGNARAVFNCDVAYTGSLIPSDMRLKEIVAEVGDVNFNVFGTEFSLKKYGYTWKNIEGLSSDNGRLNYGFLAQDVIKALENVEIGGLRGAFQLGFAMLYKSRWEKDGEAYKQYESPVFEKAEMLQTLENELEILTPPEDEKALEDFETNKAKKENKIAQLKEEMIAFYSDSHASYEKAREAECEFVEYYALTNALNDFRV